MKNNKIVFALFSVLCLFQKVNATPNNLSDVKINALNTKLIQQLMELNGAKINEESGKYFSFRTDISSNLLDRFPELTTIINKIVNNESKIASSLNGDILNTSGLEVTTGIAELEISPKNDLSTDSSVPLDTEVNQVKTNSQDRYRPSFVLGYQPITSFYHPRPVTLAQIIPLGTPWPDSIQGYKTTLRSTLKNFENATKKIEEHTTSHTEIPQTTEVYETISQNIIPAATVLGYKPITSFYHPHPVTLAQIIPAGTPWPDSADKHQTSNTTGEVQTTVSKTTPNEVESSTQHFIPPVTVLDYKPITSFFHPNPVTPAQIIPSGTPWPDSADAYQTSFDTKPTASPSKIETTTKKQQTTVSKTTLKEVERDTQYVIPPAVVLGYKPITSFYHPHPVTPGQIIPTGTPWPDSADGYQTSIVTKPTASSSKVDELLTTTKTTQFVIPPVTVLDYKPITSFHHPHPVTPAQIIPSGTPWPDSADGYQTSIATNPTASSSKVDEGQTTTKKQKTTVSKTTLKKVESSTQYVIPPVTVLDYKPITSFHHPHPVTPAQIIPSGTPWPDSVDGYQTSIATKPTASSKVDEGQTTTRKQQTTVSKTTLKEVESSTQFVIPPAIVLGYKPITSFYHPHPVTPVQIIPSGTSWPDSADRYQTSIDTKPTASSSKVNEVQTIEGHKQTTVLKSSIKEVETSTYNLILAQTNLEYKPVTSFFYPKPVTVGQIISSGKPWPDSAEGYETTLSTVELIIVPNKDDQTTILETTFVKEEANTNNFTAPPTVIASKIFPGGVDWPYPAGSNITIISQILSNLTEEEATAQKQVNNKSVNTKPSEIVSGLLLENKNAQLLEPNALSIDPDVTESSDLTAAPFTSGTPKTTLSDIVDILKDVYNITLISSTSTTAKPSEEPQVLNTTKVDLNYHDVLIPQVNDAEKNISKLHMFVYDGVPKSKETLDEERIVHNPKLDVKS